jgi:hypothetical protein
MPEIVKCAVCHGVGYAGPRPRCPNTRCPHKRHKAAARLRMARTAYGKKPLSDAIGSFDRDAAEELPD